MDYGFTMIENAIIKAAQQILGEMVYTRRMQRAHWIQTALRDAQWEGRELRYGAAVFGWIEGGIVYSDWVGGKHPRDLLGGRGSRTEIGIQPDQEAARKLIYSYVLGVEWNRC